MSHLVSNSFFAGYFLLSLLDRYYKEDISVEEGAKLLKMCITELRTRFTISAQYLAKVVDKDGIRILPLEESA